MVCATQQLSLHRQTYVLFNLDMNSNGTFYSSSCQTIFVIMKVIHMILNTAIPIQKNMKRTYCISVEN
jgi:hypothetical protein